MSVQSLARSTPQLHSVEGVLGFTQRSFEPVFSYAYDPPPGVPRTNIVPDERRIRIEDARPLAGDLSLDVEGFAVVRSPTAVRDFWDEAQTLGHPEAAELVKAATGASRVVVYDHTLRRRIDGADDRSAEAPRQPATRAHVDQTVRSGPKRVRDLMGDAAEGLLKKRSAIINVWRPIDRPARDWPLALGDARTFTPDDLIPSELRFPHRVGETYGVAYSPAQRWFYIPDLQPNEALLIKCWDSDAGVARFAPHTGFEDPTTPPGTPPRESIEFRTLAFFD
ncbi:CmcJ/NvfI family oxidoreductase [Phenylobacterium sp. LjRoot225]|uniref:CmcJ/NvfI family oxidoreductase n=1 Tax=Phenylobacterium sp. LjRoot225 TaxID=3342285 RepID=UPI003ECCAAFA